MGEKNDHITDFRPYYCTALNLQGGWFSASVAARLQLILDFYSRSSEGKYRNLFRHFFVAGPEW